MVNSATMALNEFKSQRLGGLLAGNPGAGIDAPSPMGLSGSASDALGRGQAGNSSTAFLQQIRNSGRNYDAIVQEGQARKRAAYAQQTAQNQAGGYTLPSGAGKGGSAGQGGPRGAYGLTVPAAQSFGRLQQAYKAAGMGDLGVISGGRTYAQQAQLYAAYKAGKGNKAAAPGTSLHESGIAADLGGAAHSAATKQHAWLRANAANYGWYWVGQRFGEDWHWEYHPEWGGR